MPKPTHAKTLTICAQTTSSLFAKLLVAVRTITLVLWGVVVYGDAVTTAQLTGYTITLGAFFVYSYLKHKESIESRAKVLPLTGGVADAAGVQRLGSH